MGDRLAPPAEALAQRVADRVVDLVVAALDVNALLSRVDVDALLDQVNVDGLLDRVDVDALLDRVDVARLGDRLDVDSILARVDIDGLLARTDLGTVVARSSGGVAGNALDVVRSQVVGLDEFVARWVERVRRRPYAGAPGFAGRPAAAQESLQGRYAGFASRFAAFAVDACASTVVFMLALAAISFAVSVVTGKSVNWNQDETSVGIAWLAWLFLYFAYSWAASGKTFGMAVIGIRVVRADGADAGPRRGGGPDPGTSAELPHSRPRIHRDPAGPPAPGTARRDCRNCSDPLLGRAGRPPQVPVPPPSVTGRHNRPRRRLTARGPIS